MKTATFLKRIGTIALFLGTTIVLAQDSIRIFNPLPSNSEKINLIYPKVYWFNKYKITLENYGKAKIKEGITSTSTNTKRGITYSETKQKGSISLTDSNKNTSTIEVRTTQSDEYVIKEGFLENIILRKLSTGIETDEIKDMVVYPKKMAGFITTNVKNSKNWDINLIKEQSKLLLEEIGRLTNGERTINVICTNIDSNKEINENGHIPEQTLFYEFLEKGESLGAVAFNGENSIWIKPGLDTTTKLILCLSMLLLTNF